MTNHVVLNNVEHKNLRVITDCSAKFCNAVGAIEILPNECTRAQCDYPILFLKNEEHQLFQCLAILGLSNDENLYVDDKDWHASHIPNIIKKGPFSIGFQNQVVDSVEQKKAVVLVDTEDKRVSETQGQTVFLEFGGNSRYLEQIQNVLAEIDEGIKIAPVMFGAFTKLNLLDPVVLEVEIDKENSVKFENYYTINAERLAQLSDKDLGDLNRAGFLSIAYAAIASLSNIQKLVKLKKARLHN